MSPKISPWWERFFGGDNELRWPPLSNRADQWSAHVLPWIELAESSDIDLPIVLPRLDAQGQTSWYCAGRSVRGGHLLRESLQAFIGPSYSDFNDRPYTLNLDDTVEAAFAEGTVAPVYRIRASQPADVDRIQRALELFRGLLGQVPKQEHHVQRPLGALRAELDRAVAVGDEAGARRLLDRIRRIGRLDAENLLYLEIGVRAGLGQWHDIAENGVLLNQLTGLRLPPRVLADVHEALYRLHIEPSENINAPHEALEAFHASGLMRRTTLFGSRRGLRSPRIVKSFFLNELAREDGDQILLADLARELEKLDDSFAQALASLQPATEPQSVDDSMRAADEAFDDLETDRALELYLQVPPSRKRVTRLILCAEDVGTAEAAMRMLEAVKLGDGIDNLPDSWAGRLRALKRMCETGQDSETVQGWLDWARRVEAGMNEEDAMSTLREHIVNWNSAALACDKESVAEIESIINNAAGSAEVVFREATPLLYQALMSESDAPPRSAKPLLQILLTKVAFLTDPSQNELDLARDLTAALLPIGLDEKEYANLVSDLEDLMAPQLSIFTLAWSLDLAELLAIHTCPAPEQRLRLVLRVVEEARRAAHRLSTTDSLIVEQLCKDFAIELPAEISNEDRSGTYGTGEELSGKTVGIYTLEEPAGQRAASLLKGLCPAVRVELNSDHVCTKRLRGLARSADIFIFAWKSSKHQAYYCVKDHRGRANPLIQAQGKGSSSIIRAVFEYM